MNTSKSMAAHIVAVEKVTEREFHFSVEVYDALQKKEFTGIVKMIDGVPRGQLVQLGKSPLSPACFKNLRSAVINAHNSK